MDLFSAAYDAMSEVDQMDIRQDSLTIDQRLKIAEIKALLSISQELSKIHHEGINSEYRSS